MKSILNFFKNKLNHNQKVLNKYQKSIDKINNYEKEYESLDDIAFKKAIMDYKSSNNKSVEMSFALIREASKRVLGLRHYDVQLMGGLVLFENAIAEMKTGEGKTLVSTLPAIHNALIGRKVFIVTVNDYLSKRDMELLKPIYDYFELSVSYNPKMYGENVNFEVKKTVYQSNIIYSTNNELCFDYLRSNTVKEPENEFLNDNDLDYVIIDEVDSILIDDAKSPLILSDTKEISMENIHFALDLVKNILIRSDVDQEFFHNTIIEIESLRSATKDSYDGVNGDFYFDNATRQINIFESGYEKIEKYLFEKKLITDTNEHFQSNSPIMNYINNAIQAEYGYFINRDYLVKDGRVIIIDQSTGRLHENGRWRNGLHQAVECKENVEIQPENKTIASITYQSYFNLFKNKAGMTGTAYTEARELFDIYDMETIVIPTNKEIIRTDLADRMFISKAVKYKKVMEYIIEKHNNQQPILIGTPSVYISEEIANLLDKFELQYNLLNAKNHEKEALIIENAGKLGAITIATNMAGRGTDIILGGNISRALEETDDPEKQSDIFLEWKNERDKVIEAGGLCVIGVDKNDSRRVDNQLKGRSGRQGEVGESLFFLSLDDVLLTDNTKPEVLIFAQKFFSKNSAYQDRHIETSFGSWSNTLAQSQQRVENRNFNIRKHTYQYDANLNEQRYAFYKKRKEVLHANPEELNNIFKTYIELYIQYKINLWFEKNEKDIHDIDNVIIALKDIFSEINSHTQLNLKEQTSLLITNAFNDSKTVEELIFTSVDLFEKIYNERWNAIKIIEGQNSQIDFQRLTILETMDETWSWYLDELDTIRSSSQLSVYAQKNPLTQFKIMSHELFMSVLNEIPIKSIDKMVQENMDLDLVEIQNLQDYEFSKELSEMTPEELQVELRMLTDKLMKTELLAINSKINS